MREVNFGFFFDRAIVDTFDIFYQNTTHAISVPRANSLL